MKEWKGAKAGNFDYLQYFIKKGHELGLEVHASLNVFCAGHNYFDRGMVYSGHPEWASMVYTPEKGIIPITEEKHKYGAMINPLNEEYRTHILNVLKEVVTKYSDLDGLMLDRVRYDGITADFSPLSREKFEAYIGKKVAKFPEDIFVWKKNTDGKFITQPGKYFRKWIEWRTKNITDYMALVQEKVKAANPKVSFGTYTGAWYPSYYEVGVNFASKKYDPAQDFNWATPEYKNYGYAELIDLYATGNYYTDITIEEYKKTARPKVVMTWAPHPKSLPQAVPNSFAEWMNATDYEFVITHPEGYELDPRFVGNAKVEYDQKKAFEGADFIYAKNWSAYKDPNYGQVISTDRSWTVDAEKMALTNNAYFMHCLPVRRNMIVTDDVIESPQSIVIPEAANREISAQTVLKKILMGLSNL